MSQFGVTHYQEVALDWSCHRHKRHGRLSRIDLARAMINSARSSIGSEGRYGPLAARLGLYVVLSGLCGYPSQRK